MRDIFLVTELFFLSCSFELYDGLWNIVVKVLTRVNG